MGVYTWLTRIYYALVASAGLLLSTGVAEYACRKLQIANTPVWWMNQLTETLRAFFRAAGVWFAWLSSLVDFGEFVRSQAAVAAEIAQWLLSPFWFFAGYAEAALSYVDVYIGSLLICCVLGGPAVYFLYLYWIPRSLGAKPIDMDEPLPPRRPVRVWAPARKPE